MGLHHLLIAAFAASAVLAADPPCACVNPTQTIDPITNPMIFFQQPTLGGVMNGKTCSTPCNFKASLDAGADDKATLQVQLLTNKLVGNGRIIVNGLNDSLTITPSTLPGLFYALSYDVSITLDFTEDASDLGEFMIVVQKTTGRPSPPVVKPTTTAAPTVPYDPKFTHNPLLVANDIMLAFDLSSKDIEKYKKFARDMIKELTINPKSLDSDVPEECGAGSRLSLVGLSGLSGFDNLYAPYWTTSYAQADGNINSLVQISNSNFFFNPVEEKYLHGFSKKSDKPEDLFTTCANRGKIFILFTSTSPSEYDGSPTKATPEIKFVEEGVHQILVRYDMSKDDKAYYDLYDHKTAPIDHSNIWNYFELSGGDKDIENFFNNYLVDSKEPMTCQITSTANKVEYVIGEPSKLVKVSIPPYYDARTTPTGGKDWDTVKHYCNFQDTTVRLLKYKDTSSTSSEDITTCVTVYYDLETGKDFVSIFSGNPDLPELQEEVVRLTGRDVSGTTFKLKDAIGSIVFSSDEKNVYDGFYAEITAC